MWRRSAYATVLFGLILSGCATMARWSGWGPDATGPGNRTGPAAGSQHELVLAENRVRELEARLLDRDREIAAARAEIGSLQLQAGKAGGSDQSAAPSASSGNRASSGSMPGAAAPSEAENTARAEADRATRQLAGVEAQLGRERRRRKVLEQDLASLREETSSNPFERQQEADSNESREQIAELKRELAAQNEQREELARRYEALQSQVQTQAAARADDADPRSDLATLENEQSRVLADLRRDLAESHATEEQLREALSAQRSGDITGSPMVGQQTLAAENSALQARLADERRRNEELATKLKAAMRVTDLIFKMQGVSTGGGVGAEP